MEVRKGFKQTEVAIIPDDWDLKPLNVLTNQIIDGTHFTPKYTELGVPFLRVTDIQDTEIDFNEIKFISPEEHHFLTRRCKPEKGDLLLSKNGTIGIPKIVTWDWEFSIFVSLALLKPKTKLINVQFLEQFFKSEYLVTQIQKRSKQGAVTNLHLEEIREFLIPIPPILAEQEAIAEALSDADALIEAVEQLLAKKRQVKQGAMSELLTGKRRLAGFSEDWNEKTFPEICWYQEGPGVRTTQFTHSGIKLLNGTNIFRGVIDLEKTDRYISEKEAFGAYAHFLADAGDIVIASSGITIDRFEDKVAFVKEEHLPLCMNTSTIRFKAHPNSLKPSFLYFLFMSDAFKKQIGPQATGSAQLNFGPAHLNKIVFMIPSLAEQTAIAEILSDMDAEITALEEKLVKARQVKAGMMSELLTGKIRLV